jgi:hypothetical protein
LQLANDEEWAWVEDRLRSAIGRNRDFKRECLVGFLTSGLEERKRPDEAAELIRDLGTPEQPVSLLIDEGREPLPQFPNTNSRNRIEVVVIRDQILQPQSLHCRDCQSVVS